LNLSIVKGSAGLNTESDQARTYYGKDASPYTGNRGLSFFSACMDIDIDDEKRISRRKGMIKRVPENALSLHVISERFLLFGADDGLFLLQAGFTGYTLIATVTPGRVSAVTVDGVTYWTNNVQKGKIIDGVNYPWVKGTVVSDNLTRIFYDPPVGKYLAYHNGQILVGAGKTIWKSEPYGPDVFALDDYYSLESDVSMVRPVGGGIYIADSERTFFVTGNDWKPVDNHPALAYASTDAVGTMIEGKFTSGGKTQVAFWLTNEGVIFGDAVGNVQNITEERIDLLGPYSSGAILVDGSTLIANFIK
jgi:hypothetical protein